MCTVLGMLSSLVMNRVMRLRKLCKMLYMSRAILFTKLGSRNSFFFKSKFMNLRFFLIFYNGFSYNLFSLLVVEHILLAERKRFGELGLESAWLFIKKLLKTIWNSIKNKLHKYLQVLWSDKCSRRQCPYPLSNPDPRIQGSPRFLNAIN
jgi:hypothetical protein